MFAMMDRSQWTGQGVSEPTIPPSLAQMFALARRMGYEMPANRRDLHECRSPPDRDIVHLFGRDVTSPKSSFSAADRFGTCNRKVNNSGTLIRNRETPFRPEPHSNWSECHSSGLQCIIINRLNPTDMIRWLISFNYNSHCGFRQRYCCTVSGSRHYRTDQCLDSPDYWQFGYIRPEGQRTGGKYTDQSTLEPAGNCYWWSCGWCRPADIGHWTLVPGGMDWRSFGGVPRGLGIVGYGYGRLSISDFGPCWSTSGSVRMHFKDTTRCQWDRYRGVRMFSLCGVVHWIAEFPILVCDLASGTDAIIGTVLYVENTMLSGYCAWYALYSHNWNELRYIRC